MAALTIAEERILAEELHKNKLVITAVAGGWFEVISLDPSKTFSGSVQPSLRKILSEIVVGDIDEKSLGLDKVS